MTLYLLPGVGCDRRMFSRLDLTGMDVVLLEWPAFPRNCSLVELARTIRPQVDADRPHVLAGVSMGGMVVQELALLTRPQQVILISTWTGPDEWPWHVRWAGILGLAVLIGPATMRLTWPLKRMLGPRPREVDRLLWAMAVDQGAYKIRRGVQGVLHWPGGHWTGPVYRIHGDRDHVIPLRFPADHVVRGGEHIMVLTRADEVAAAIRKAVQTRVVNPV